MEKSVYFKKICVLKVFDEINKNKNKIISSFQNHFLKILFQLDFYMNFKISFK